MGSRRWPHKASCTSRGKSGTYTCCFSRRSLTRCVDVPVLRDSVFQIGLAPFCIWKHSSSDHSYGFVIKGSSTGKVDGIDLRMATSRFIDRRLVVFNVCRSFCGGRSRRKKSQSRSHHSGMICCDSFFRVIDISASFLSDY